LSANYWIAGTSSICVQLIMGSFAIWVALRPEPLRMRGGDIYQNQRFIRAALRVLGLALIVGGLWELWIKWKS
jgi:hypothetical protein